jgi:hypothetical protein
MRWSKWRARAQAGPPPSAGQGRGGRARLSRSAIGLKTGQSRCEPQSRNVQETRSALSERRIGRKNPGVASRSVATASTLPISSVCRQAQCKYGRPHVPVFSFFWNEIVGRLRITGLIAECASKARRCTRGRPIEDVLLGAAGLELRAHPHTASSWKSCMRSLASKSRACQVATSNSRRFSGMGVLPGDNSATLWHFRGGLRSHPVLGGRKPDHVTRYSGRNAGRLQGASIYRQERASVDDFKGRKIDLQHTRSKFSRRSSADCRRC